MAARQVASGAFAFFGTDDLIVLPANQKRQHLELGQLGSDNVVVRSFDRLDHPHLPAPALEFRLIVAEHVPIDVPRLVEDARYQLLVIVVLDAFHERQPFGIAHSGRADQHEPGNQIGITDGEFDGDLAAEAARYDVVRRGLHELIEVGVKRPTR